MKKTTAINEALKIFEMCEYLLPYSSFKDNVVLERKIQFELGECEFLLKQYDQADERFKILMAKSSTKEELVEVQCKYMDLYEYSGHSEKVLEIGMDALENLKFDMRDNHLIHTLYESNKCFRKIKLER